MVLRPIHTPKHASLLNSLSVSNFDYTRLNKEIFEKQNHRAKIGERHAALNFSKNSSK